MSRIVVFLAFTQAPGGASAAVANWDGAWYRRIAMHGYEFAKDGRWHSIAFFPLFPALIATLSHAGLGFDVAAVLISNGCYLAMLAVVYDWTSRRNGERAARWTVALLSFLPLSLFGSVAYAEAPFMLCSSLALRQFQADRYRSAALWSALASLARLNGICLAMAFVAATVIERRGKRSLGVAAAACVGVGVMATIGWLRFGDASAFIDAQHAWRHSFGGGMDEWRTLLSSGTLSFGHWRLDLYVLPVVIALVSAGTRLYRAARLALWSVVVAVQHLCWGRDFAFAVIALLGGGAVVWFRRRLGVSVVVYAGAAAALLLTSGSSMSADRIAFGVVPFALALGLVAERLPYLAIPLLVASAIDLFASAAAFARSAWVA